MQHRIDEPPPRYEDDERVRVEKQKRSCRKPNNRRDAEVPRSRCVEEDTIRFEILVSTNLQKLKRFLKLNAKISTSTLSSNFINPLVSASLLVVVLQNKSLRERSTVKTELTA